MPQHKTCEEEFGCVAEDVAIKVANLRYDEVRDFFRQLQRKFEADAAVDKERGRPLLSRSLSRLAKHIEKAAIETDKAWEISEKFIAKTESSPQ